MTDGEPADRDCLERLLDEALARRARLKHDMQFKPDAEASAPRESDGRGRPGLTTASRTACRYELRRGFLMLS